VALLSFQDGGSDDRPDSGWQRERRHKSQTGQRFRRSETHLDSRTLVICSLGVAASTIVAMLLISAC
jgi:hypothetical protein